jgi:hypothetical protein
MYHEILFLPETVWTSTCDDMRHSKVLSGSIVKIGGAFLIGLHRSHPYLVQTGDRCRVSAGHVLDSASARRQHFSIPQR